MSKAKDHGLGRIMSIPTYIALKRALHILRGPKRVVQRSFFGRKPKRVSVATHPLPRKIWLYWHQGEADAPPLVRRCLQSWRDLNPGWEVTVLDACSHHTWVDMPDLPEKISLNHYANILRVSLLERHGGVWADATIICTRPLSDWLPVLAAQSGFFAFSWIGQDRDFLGDAPKRTICNWFLASEPGGTLISAWADTTRNYWIGREEAPYYFWHNASFEWLLLTNRAVRRAWERTPKMGALAPHLAWHYLTTGEKEVEIRAALATGAIPMHKLSWRMDTPVEDIEALLLTE